MPDTVTLRLVIDDPVPGVALAVQRGRDAIVPPVRITDAAVTFELTATVRTRPDGTRTLAGDVVQGPPAARFIYVTVGMRAGQPGSPWDRRAKVPLSSLPETLLATACERTDTVLVAHIGGRARDGGPACASVPLTGGGWRLAPRGA